MHQQTAVMAEDIGVSCSFDMTGHNLNAESPSHGMGAFASGPSSSGASSGRDTFTTVPNILSQYDCTFVASPTTSNICHCPEHDANLLCRLRNFEQ